MWKLVKDNLPLLEKICRSELDNELAKGGG